MYPNGDDLIFVNIQRGNIYTIRIIHTRRFRVGLSATSTQLLSSFASRELLIGAGWGRAAIEAPIRAWFLALPCWLAGVELTVSFDAKTERTLPDHFHEREGDNSVNTFVVIFRVIPWLASTCSIRCWTETTFPVTHCTWEIGRKFCIFIFSQFRSCKRYELLQERWVFKLKNSTTLCWLFHLHYDWNSCRYIPVDWTYFICW